VMDKLGFIVPEVLERDATRLKATFVQSDGDPRAERVMGAVMKPPKVRYSSWNKSDPYDHIDASYVHHSLVHVTLLPFLLAELLWGGQNSFVIITESA